MHQIKYILRNTALAAAAWLLSGTLPAMAQIVANPGFETYSSCPTASSQLSRATGWSQRTNGTPDFYDCAYNASPLFQSTTLAAQSGTGYAGFYAESYIAGGDYKEYITNTLTSPMVTGTTYTITFYLRSNVDGSSNNIALPANYRGDLGLAFSSVAPTSANAGNSGYGSILNTFAPNSRVYIPASSPVYTATAWTAVTLQYTATGGEQYMTLGQYRPGTVGSSASVDTSVYFYADNFSVSTTTALPVKLLAFDAALDNRCHATLIWKTAYEQNTRAFVPEYSADGNLFTGIGEVPCRNSATGGSYSYRYNSVQPGAGYFRLKIAETDGSYMYSQTVAVHAACDAPQLLVLPNPATTTVTVSGLAMDQQVRIFSATGALVWKQTAVTTAMTVDIAGLAAGLYLVQVSGAQGMAANVKLVKQ